MKVCTTFLILLFVAISISNLLAQKDQKLALEKASEFVSLLESESYEAATSTFAPNVSAQLTAERLMQLWVTLPKQIGEYQGHEEGKFEADTSKKMRAIIKTALNFEKSKVMLTLAYDQDWKVSGIFFAPIPSEKPSNYRVPEYSKPAQFEEISLVLESAGYKLPAVFTQPKDTKKFAVCIFVHGSGPNDKDVSIGDNKVFRDLALGLASKGIASFRYDKRTFADPKRFVVEHPQYTVHEEVLQDVQSAIHYITKKYSKSITKVYVVGHSLGGYLMPRIAFENPYVDGLVMLAGAARPIQDLMVEQTEYLSNRDGELDENEKLNLQATKDGAKLISTLTDPSNLSDTLNVFGIPSSYWYDLNMNPPLQQVKHFGDRPVLIIQGGRDYQVTETDFNLWKEALKDRPKSDFKFFPDLNHILMTGEGPPNPKEYEIPNHVSEEMIYAIAEWVKKENR